MAKPCGWGDIKRAAGVDADGPIKSRLATPTIKDGADADVRSFIFCPKGSPVIPKFGMRQAGKTPLHFRSNSRNFHHTCTLLAALTVFAGAIHSAAFLTRTGQGKFLMGSTENRGCSSSSRTLSPPCRSSGLSSRSRLKLFDFKGSPSISPRLSSLLMAQSSDVELQFHNAQSEVEDEDEWRTVVAAFQMYKAAYGDLKVPSRFIVPGMAPWPGEKTNLRCCLFFTLFLLSHTTLVLTLSSYDSLDQSLHGR